MRADAQEKRAALVDAAWRLIAGKGPDVSLRAIAAEAGVGIATLYRHFPTRDDLIVGVVSEMVDRVVAVIDARADRWGSATEAEDSWRAVAHGIAALELGAVAEQTVAVIPEDGKIWQATGEYRDRLLTAYRDLLERAASYGLVSPDLTVWRFHLGLAAISRPLPERVEDFAPGQADWLVDVYLAGLRP